MTELKIVFRKSNVEASRFTLFIDCDGCEYDVSWNICEVEKTQDINKLPWKPFSYHSNDMIHHLENRHGKPMTLPDFDRLFNGPLLAEAWKEANS